RPRIDGLLVCSASVLAVGGYVLGKLLDDPHLRGCGDCSRNLLLVYGDKTLSSIANDSANALAVVVALAILITLVLRRQAAGPPGRRVLAPIFWTAPVAIAVAVLGFVRDSDVAVGSVLDHGESHGAPVERA